MDHSQSFRTDGGVVTGTAGCGRSLTPTDLLLCLLPVGFFLSIVSLV
jgi:hypothetical protein